METLQQSPFSNDQYTVGWICALPIELAAAKGMLDEEHGAPQTPAAEADQNSYLLGRVGNFKVVVACLPKDQIGSVSAAVVARDMVSTFPKIRIGLLVGIGAGIPDEENDIRLGDVVISSDKASGGVVVYDFGKRLADGSFQSISILNRPPRSLSSALVQLEAAHKTREKDISRYIDTMLQKYPVMRKTGYRRPAQDTDRLFEVHYQHSAGRTCKGCDPSEEVDREPREDEYPVIHYGTIATGDSVIKHGPTREELKQKHNAICLEMEASGLMNNFPCLVIRGVSDYADSHKNDRWHAYAAAAGAGCAKEVLQYVQPKEVDLASAAKDVLGQGTRLEGAR
jgi:nucleoside phosphorylase